MRINKKNEGIFFSLWLLILGLLSSSSSQADGMKNLDPTCNCFSNIPYGHQVWFEEYIGKELTQDFNLYPPETPSTSAPVVIYAHANGATKNIITKSPAYSQIILPAVQAGFAVISVEFRHPVANDYIIPPPHADIARALQYVRANAKLLYIDPNNVFYLGHSRGTLVTLSGVHNDLANPNSSDIVKRQSTRVNAIYAYNVQATYEGQETADEFIVPDEREGWVGDC